MYDRVLLASDGSRESLRALREGALIARAFHSRVLLLLVDLVTPAERIADGLHPLPYDSDFEGQLVQGLERLRRLGLSAEGKVTSGEPAIEIARWARQFQADLIVVGHRKRTLFERWWSGRSGSYVVDHVECSVLVARNVISDAEFEARLQKGAVALNPIR